MHNHEILCVQFLYTYLIVLTKACKKWVSFFCEKIGSISFVYLHVNESKKWESDNFLYLYVTACFNSWKYFYFHFTTFVFKTPEYFLYTLSGNVETSQSKFKFADVFLSWFSNKKACRTTNFNFLFALLVIRESLGWLYLKSLSKHLSLYYSPFCIGKGKVGSLLM